jgi:hypothetical protein
MNPYTDSLSDESEGIDGEVVLREAQGVIFKSSLVMLEGNLVLTNKHLLFSVAKWFDDISRIEDRIDLDDTNLGTEDSDDNDDQKDSNNLSISLDSIVFAEGRKDLFRPSLLVTWHDDETNQTTRAEFIQKTKSLDVGSESISDWDSLIEQARASQISKIQNESSAQYNWWTDNLESRILAILEEVEWKGLFKIREELKQESNEDLDVDKIEASCKKLVAQKLVEQDAIGEFFRKRASPTTSQSGVYPDV